ncbi:MAG: hypothetical protein JJU11_12910 [Candidatus Sumerlaeia bacterium]|nr:hypothetical protein [Candidatus Sumerlaeia bacterium]
MTPLVIATMFLALTTTPPTEGTILIHPSKERTSPPLLDPVLFSDAEEDPSSRTRIGKSTVENEAGGHDLRLRVELHPNENLGYQYAGISFPLEDVRSIHDEGILSFTVKAHESVDLQVNHRDGTRTNHFGETFTLTGGQWETIVINTESLEGDGMLTEVALVLTMPGRTTLDIQTISLPVTVGGDSPQVSTAEAGMSYHFRAPGAYFSEAVPISDRDESSRSTTMIRLETGVDTIDGRPPMEYMGMRYTVSPNPGLGYSYGGFAIPFHAPMSLISNGEFHFKARATPLLEDGLQVTLRDTDHRRSSHHVKIHSDREWQDITIPAGKFTGIDTGSLESIAFVIVREGEGTVDIANLRLPVLSDAENLGVLDRIRSRPKIYTNAGMAAQVAASLGRPLLVLRTTDIEASRQISLLLEDPRWRELLAKVIITNAAPEGDFPPDSKLLLISTDNSLLVNKSTLDDTTMAAVATQLSRIDSEPQ